MTPDATSHPVAAAFADCASAVSLAGVREFGPRSAEGRRDHPGRTSARRSLAVRLAGTLFLLVAFPRLGTAVCGGGGVSALPGPAVTFLRSYRAGLDAPARMAVDASGNVYVTDPIKGEVVVRAQTGRVVSRGTAFGYPVSIAVDAAGRLYVGDGASGSVAALGPDWQTQFVLGQGAGEFLLPNDIDVDATTGTIFVVDSKAHVVKAYSSSGALLRSFGGSGSGDGQFNFPVALFVDAAARQVLVVDQLNFRVQTFDLDGNFVSCFGGSQGSDPGKFNVPHGVWADGQGRIYVTDSFEGRVQVLDRNGDFIGYIGDFGEQPGQLRVPTDLVVDPLNRLFVSSANNARLEVFGVDAFADPESIVPAVLDIEPDPLDTARPEAPVVGHVEIPGYPLDQVAPGSITANGVASTGVASVGDHDGDGIPDLRVEFDWAALLATLPAEGRGAIAVTGTIGSKQFEGANIVEVISTLACRPDMPPCSLGAADPQCNEAVCEEPIGCTVRPRVDGTACEDGEVCSVGDACSSGFCIGGIPPVCDDGDVCTDDFCAPGVGCAHLNNTAVCDDGSLCTTADSCVDGVCVGASPPDCDDGNACTDDSCDPALGCVHADNTASCNDGDRCTVDDACSAGGCTAGPPVRCDDGNACTDDSCAPATGCVHVNNTGVCDDGSLCTTVDSCVDGVCLPGPPLVCDDANTCTDDSCDPARGCVHVANAGRCDDGDRCTVDDTCSAGRCVSGGPANCDDANVCTADSCDPALGCVHVFLTSGRGVKRCRKPKGTAVGEGVADVAGYAIIEWSPGAGVMLLGRYGHVGGNVCADSIRALGSSQVDGDVVSMRAVDRAITFQRATSVTGDVVTGGGLILGLEGVTVGGRVDTRGMAAELDDCVAAASMVSTRRADLVALPATLGLSLGSVRVEPRGSGVITVTGAPGVGVVVVEATQLRLGGSSTLTLAGGPDTEEVVVRVGGPVRLGDAARLVTEGIAPEQVIFVVDGAVTLGSRARLAGTVLAKGRTRLRLESAVEGAIVGSDNVTVGAYAAVDPRPFVGW